MTHPRVPDPSPPISEAALPPLRPSAPAGDFLFGNEFLWILLPSDGVLQLRPGEPEVKFGWWRMRGMTLTISGRRLDEDAPTLGSRLPDGYYGAFQAGSLIFPAPGCWEVTGTTTGSLTFVVYVRAAEDAQLGTPPPGNVACTSNEEVLAIFRRSIEAFNSGDTQALTDAISPYAQWFSLTIREGHEVAYGRAAMAEHLKKRHASGDRFGGSMINVTTLIGWDGSAHFGITSMSITRDGQLRHLHGKGALQCGTRASGIVALSLGEP